ncbi:MAG: TIGR02147 family protein [Deltaproteobacteria bacterium]|nr:TIGR02147 family protein [Deltaproteobacteria bacterium]
MKSEPTIPITSFDSTRALLNSVLTRKGKNKLGLRELARKAGFSSPATLGMIRKGHRRLTPAVAERLAKALSLTGRKKRYLVTLAEFECSESEQNKLEKKEELIKLRSLSEEKSLTLQQYRCLALWYYPALYTLVSSQLFRRDPLWIANKLGGKITPTQIKQAIGDLLNLGLLREENGSLVPVDQTLTTSEDVKSVAVRRYHEQMISKAGEALSLPLETREMNGVTICISKKSVQAIKEKIRAFRKELNETFSQDPEAQEVYQINIQFFPLTKNAQEQETVSENEV